MDYADAVATFSIPRPAGTPPPEAVRAGGPARRLRDACEPLAMHALWNRHTNERLAALGLDFLTSYVGGRAASLGEPSPPVVVATFAWFEPELLAGLYEAARSTAPRERLLAVREVRLDGVHPIGGEHRLVVVVVHDRGARLDPRQGGLGDPGGRTGHVPVAVTGGGAVHRELQYHRPGHRWLV